MNNILSVSEITSKIKISLEENFSEVTVIGELSNYKAHVSGHWYFTLKDSNAQISCTMWKGMNSYVFFTPSDGMKIIVTGRLTVYPPRGSYQIEVRSMKPAGVGELQAAFEKLKSKLADEGLFDTAHKKEIPVFPKKIAIVTAIDGAALQDMINIAKRRFPVVELVVYPSKVQGEGAAENIAEGIKKINQLKDIDLIIAGRGGGSLEDLWAFNEEVVARAIFNSTIPVISAVGHEIDFTIADFVADLRAPTPSAAMELATPNKDDIFAFMNEFSYNSTENIFGIIQRFREKILQTTKSYGFKLPRDVIKNKIQFLDNLFYRIEKSVESILESERNKLAIIGKILEARDVNNILRKGFAIVKQEQKYIKRGNELRTNKPFDIKFFDKEIRVSADE